MGRRQEMGLSRSIRDLPIRYLIRYNNMVLTPSVCTRYIAHLKEINILILSAENTFGPIEPYSDPFPLGLFPKGNPYQAGVCLAPCFLSSGPNSPNPKTLRERRWPPEESRVDVVSLRPYITKYHKLK